MRKVYYGEFTCWKDVAKHFECNEKEPEEVIYAAYNNEDYSGDAIVIYRNENKYFIVEGGHCSCYGLEDQWHPEDYDISEFKGVIKIKEFYPEGTEQESIIESLKKYIEEI